MSKYLIKHIDNIDFIFLKKAIQKETRFPHIAMRVNASETPFFKFNYYVSMC